MADKFIVAQYQKSFATEAEASKGMEAIAAGRDAQRPADKRFEVEALKRAIPTKLVEGAQLISVGDMAFIVAPNQRAGCDLFGTGKGMSFSTLAEAKEWVSEFAQLAPGRWKIFEHCD